MSDWWLRDGWADDTTRYGARHKWQRKMALKNLRPHQRCPRCNERLIPERFRDENGDYRIPRKWAEKNLHLDHQDGTDTGYNGLAHYDCNFRAAQRKKGKNSWPK